MDLPPKTTPEHVAQVAAWLREGASRADILEAIESELGLKPCDELIAAGLHHLAQDLTSSSAEDRLAWHVETRRHLYQMALSIHDYNTCRQILADLAKLEGLYPKASRPISTDQPPKTTSHGRKVASAADRFGVQ